MIHIPTHERLRNYCDRHQVTLKVFSVWSGVSVPTLTTFLLGTAYPQQTTIAKILDALTRTPDEHRRRLERLVAHA